MENAQEVDVSRCWHGLSLMSSGLSFMHDSYSTYPGSVGDASEQATDAAQKMMMTDEALNLDCL